MSSVPRFPGRMRIVRIRQHDTTDCGAACLYSIARYHGRRVSIARIREHACTDERGSNVLGMVQAAEKLGFSARGVRGVPASLPAVPKPTIAHVTIDGGGHHYVVLHRVASKTVVIMDPADGRVHKVPIGDFLTRWTGVLILLVPDDGFTHREETGSAGSRLWSLLRPHRTLLAQSFIGAAFHTLLGLSTAIYVQKIVDRAVPDGNQNMLNLLGVAMLVVLAAQALIGWVRSRITLVTGHRIDAALLSGYHRHLLLLPERFFDTRRVGEVTARFGEAVKIRALINDVAVNLMVSGLVLVLSAGLMLTYSPELSLVALAGLPLYGLVYLVSDRVNRTAQRELMERAADMEAELVEGLQAVTTTRAFGAQAWARSRVEVRLVRLLRAVHRSGMNAIGVGSAMEAITRVVTVLMLWLGAGLVIRGSMTTGELMSFYALTGYLTGPLTTLIAANRTIHDAVIAADRLFEIMDLELEEPDPLPALPVRIGTIRLEDVTVRYGTGPPVLQGLSMELVAERTTAIVGESGSGKSTIAGVLMGFHPLSDGRVTAGGRDVRHFSRADLRERVGLVPQKVTLFSASVIENIALGDPEPDLRRVLEVCDALGITPILDRLPAGPLTTLGDGGVTLSGGERQRIALARVLYRDPEVLVLDEATSALDARAESLVRRALMELRSRGRTIVVISHRLRAIADSDRIVVLGNGRVCEQGVHADLLGRRGKYRALWEAQHPPIADPIPGESRSVDRPGGQHPPRVAQPLDGRDGGRGWTGSIVG